MKRLLAWIPAAFMFGILAVLLIFMCLPQFRGDTKAKGGVLDAEGPPHILPLQGEWEFVYGELLTPTELSHRETELINAPASWTAEGYPTNGCATYRLTVLTDARGPLMVYLPEIPSAYTLWVNGEMVRSGGTVSEDPDLGEPFFENALVPVRAEDGRVELVLQISNYHFVHGGISGILLLGESGAVQAWFYQTRFLSCIALGCILMAAFYHLSLFIYRRREKAYLFFSLLCFLCFLRFLTETNGLNEYFQWIPMNILGMRFYLFIFFLHGTAIAVFSLYIFNRDLLAARKGFLFPYIAVILLLSLLAPTNTEFFLLITAAFTLPLMLYVTIIAARSPLMKNKSIMGLYFAALVLYSIVGLVTKLFFDNLLFMPGLLTNMFMVMSQSLVLSRRYTDALRFAEETNQNLERIVDERTKGLQAANAAMAATNNSMKELVSNISHDLKTPLAVMSLNLETLSAHTVTRSDSHYQRHVRTAFQQSLDLQRLIQNLFEISRIEAGRNLYSTEWVPLLQILTQTRERYDTFLEDIGLSFDIDPGDDCDIATDPQKIWSVFDNIIYNAARYTKSGGITVTAQRDGQLAAVTITDTGCGIPRSQMPFIFDRFYRGSAARSASDGESGLGLYIVKSIMEGCGGSVAAQSEQGKGLSVILSFPARNAVDG